MSGGFQGMAFGDSERPRAPLDQRIDGVVRVSLTGVVIAWSPGSQAIFGYTAAQMIGQPLFRLFPAQKSQEQRLFNTVKHGQIVHRGLSAQHGTTGKPIHISALLCLIADDHSSSESVLVIVRSEANKDRLVSAVTDVRAMINASDNAMISKSLDGCVTTWSKSAESLFGYAESEVLGSRASMIFPADRHDEERFLIERVVQGELIQNFRTWRTHKDGTQFPVTISVYPIQLENGEIQGAFESIRSCLGEIEHEKNVIRRLHRDELTGLSNRTGFELQVAGALARSMYRSPRVAVLFIDLDNFKLFNEAYGNAFGNNLLLKVAANIDRCLDDIVECARFGPDEFTVCVIDYNSITDVQKLAQGILTAINGIKSVQGTEVTVSASIGIATSHNPDIDAERLIRNAENALNEAKRKGKRQTRFFSDTLVVSIEEDINLVNDLGLAIKRGQLSLNFQPILNSTGTRIVKAEALLRWRHPERGFISPEIFIPVAENNGLIQALGDWVLETSLLELRSLVDRYGTGFQLSINKSPHEFYDHDRSISMLTGLLEKHALSGENVVFEITEYSFLKHNQVTQRILDSYRGMGVKIALDDFGTGYASLSYLKQYDVDYIKIDRSFVASLEPGSKEIFLCEGIIQIARKMNISVVAEGIETQDQFSLLSELGCHYFQGYHFGRPVPIDEFNQKSLLSDRRIESEV